VARSPGLALRDRVTGWASSAGGNVRARPRGQVQFPCGLRRGVFLGKSAASSINTAWGAGLFPRLTGVSGEVVRGILVWPHEKGSRKKVAARAPVPEMSPWAAPLSVLRFPIFLLSLVVFPFRFSIYVFPNTPPVPLHLGTLACGYRGIGFATTPATAIAPSVTESTCSASFQGVGTQRTWPCLVQKSSASTLNPAPRSSACNAS